MDRIKEKLDKELKDIQFSSNQQVLDKLNKKSFIDKWKIIMNKEVEIPLVPVMGVSILFIAIISIYSFIDQHSPSEEYPDKIIEKGGNFYWESWFNEVRKHES